MSRIVILGQGVIGSFFGAALADVHEVTHLVRPPGPKRADIARAFTDRRPRRFRAAGAYTYSCSTDPAVCARADLVLIPVSHRALAAALELVAPHPGPGTIDAIAGNVWPDLDALPPLPRPPVVTFPNFGGAIADGRLTGWQTGRLTTGAAATAARPGLARAEALLAEAGFAAHRERDITGWLRVHFAASAGTMLVASRAGGYARLTGPDIRRAQAIRREAMDVVRALGTVPSAFSEGRPRPVWLRALGLRAMRMLPGMAKQVDAGRNPAEWESYSRAIAAEANRLGVATPVLQAALG